MSYSGKRRGEEGKGREGISQAGSPGAIAAEDAAAAAAAATFKLGREGKLLWLWRLPARLSLALWTSTTKSPSSLTQQQLESVPGKREPYPQSSSCTARVKEFVGSPSGAFLPFPSWESCSETRLRSFRFAPAALERSNAWPPQDGGGARRDSCR